MKYRFIDPERSKHSVALLCQVLRVSPQGFYRWQKRELSPRQRSNAALLEQIRSVHQKSRRTYGSPRIHWQLREAGIPCSCKRVARLMRVHGIRAKTVRRFRVTTNSAHALTVAPNLLNRQFRVGAPNQAWVTDITYVPTQEGWLYLCVYLDLFSRRIVGWAMSERMSAELVSSALSMAVGQRRPGAGLLVHSDQGSQYASDLYQYASDLYQRHLKRNEFVCSMSRKGNCWDNAPAESFFHTLKGELTHHANYRTRTQARGEIFEFIEGFYNRARRHSTLNYQTPLQFERRFEHETFEEQHQTHLAA